MPLNFLLASPSYLARTSPEVIKRREIVLSFMNGVYKLPRGAPPRALATVKAAGLVNTKGSSVSVDAAIYRNGFRWLAGSPEEKEKIKEMIQKRRSELFGAVCLIQDGFNTWPEVESKIGNGQLPTPATTPAEITTPATQTAELVSFTRTQLHMLNQAAGQLFDQLALNEKENEILRVRVAKLEDQLAKIKVMKIEDLAEELPSVAELLEMVTAPKPKDTKPQPAPTVNQHPITEFLPEYCQSMQRPIKYSDSFQKTFRELDTKGRTGIVKAVKLLSEQGPVYPGLGTTPLPPGADSFVNPEDCLKIRAGKKRRLVFRRQAESVEFLKILNRGDKELACSEF